MVKTATETLEPDTTGPESQGPGTREVYWPVNSVVRNKLANVHENIFLDCQLSYKVCFRAWHKEEAKENSCKG